MPTKRISFVRVVNETGRDIEAANIVHKYSDVYKNRGEFGKIRNGGISNAMSVEYNTGFLTTGQDWWQITWQHEPEVVHYSDPTNFRGIVDFTESLMPNLVGIAAQACLGIDQKTAKIVSEFSRYFFNSESTVGFKKHFLTSEDEGDKVKIFIKGNGDIRISSPSGDSDTVSSFCTLK